MKVDHSITTVSRSRVLSSSTTIASISTIMATAQIINCLVCMQPVWPRQQGVQCDGYRWSHRICNTGKFSNISRMSVP